MYKFEGKLQSKNSTVIIITLIVSERRIFLITLFSVITFWDNFLFPHGTVTHVCGCPCLYAYPLSCFVNIGLEHIEAAITTLHTLFLISTFYQT